MEVRRYWVKEPPVIQKRFGTKRATFIVEPVVVDPLGADITLYCSVGGMARVITVGPVVIIATVHCFDMAGQEVKHQPKRKTKTRTRTGDS